MRLFLLFCLLASFRGFSQTATEKYNSLYNRYEYFDSNGTMTGYKVYNKMSSQWEYYSTQTQNTRPQYNTVKEPIDTKFMGDALMYQEQKSKNNYNRIVNTINGIRNTINSSDVEAETRKKLTANFNQCVDEINRAKVDISSDLNTNRAIKYLNDCFDSAI